MNSIATSTKETEEALVDRARNSISESNWVVGECAARWTKKFARGRTDGDFAALIGLSSDQVYQRRRVWEKFGETYGDFSQLRWSHFYVALTWDDAAECLDWAEQNDGSVAEMKAWRRIQHDGEAAPEPEPDFWTGDPNVQFVPTELTPVKLPLGNPVEAPFVADNAVSTTGKQGKSPVDAAAGESARETAYTPFRKGAASPPPGDSSDAAPTKLATKPQLTPEQMIKRLTGAVERMNKSLTPDILKECRALPSKQTVRFVDAVRELNQKAAQLNS